MFSIGGRGRALDDPHAASPAGALRAARLFQEDAGSGGGQVQVDRRVGLVHPVIGQEADGERGRSHCAGV